MQPSTSRQPSTSGPDVSGLLIRLLLVLLFAIGVIGILFLAPAEASTLR